MPYIVVVVDEMSDLMLVAGKEIENYIQKLSQMAMAKTEEKLEEMLLKDK